MYALWRLFKAANGHIIMSGYDDEAFDKMYVKLTSSDVKQITRLKLHFVINVEMQVCYRKMYS